MNRKITQSLLTAGIAALLGTATLSASNYLMKVDIPFSFQAGQKQAAAGSYVFGKDVASSIFKIRSQGQGDNFLVLAPRTMAGKDEKPRLVFHCYGDQCALSEIWMSTGTGYRVGTESFDQKMHRQLRLSPRVVSISFEPR